jgi:hypothetical protein
LGNVQLHFNLLCISCVVKYLGFLIQQLNDCVQYESYLFWSRCLLLPHIWILTALASDFSSIRTTMSDDGDHTCPLCAEEMDITDQQLKPCKCGYDVCISIIPLSYQSVCTYCPLPQRQPPPQQVYDLKQQAAIYSINCLRAQLCRSASGAGTTS